MHGLPWVGSDGMNDAIGAAMLIVSIPLALVVGYGWGWNRRNRELSNNQPCWWEAK
jgi:hypothetical protein